MITGTRNAQPFIKATQRRNRDMTRTILALPILASLSGLTLAQEVKHNYDPTVDFSKFTTYKWVNIDGAPQADSITDRQIKADVDADLASKGLTRVDTDDATLYV